MARRAGERPSPRPRQPEGLAATIRQLARQDLRRTALGAFLIGVALHACVAYAVLDEGEKEGLEGRPVTIETSPLPTATPARLADRRDCNAIRGTDYRSESERQWFLANCN